MAWARNRRRERTRIGLAAIVGLIGILYAMVVVVVRDAGNGEAAPVAGRIELLRAADPGGATWGATGGSRAPTGPLSIPPITAAAGTSAPASVAIAAFEGSTPNLYGGSRRSRCDVDGFAGALSQEPGRDSAWARAAGTQDSLATFLGQLTEVALIRDTRVTGWRSALAPFQGILERGTAVLVDEFGVPRVRCAGLMPLSPPRPVPTAPSYAGAPWPGFDPAAVAVVVARAPVDTFTLVDLDGSGAGPIRRRPGERPR